MKLNKRFEKQRDKRGDTVFFLIIIILGLISSWLIYSLLKNYFNADFGGGIEIDPFAGISTIIIGVFSLVILKRQTEIIDKQVEISNNQNKIALNALEMQCDPSISIETNRDPLLNHRLKLSIVNNGGCNLVNLLIYIKRENEQITLLTNTGSLKRGGGFYGPIDLIKGSYKVISILVFFRNYLTNLIYIDAATFKEELEDGSIVNIGFNSKTPIDAKKYDSILSKIYKKELNTANIHKYILENL